MSSCQFVVAFSDFLKGYLVVLGGPLWFIVALDGYWWISIIWMGSWFGILGITSGGFTGVLFFHVVVLGFLGGSGLV